MKLLVLKRLPSHYGLIGYPLSHSFSQAYFQQKFKRENLPHTYTNFEIQHLKAFFEGEEIKNLSGFNVTIPYKEQILPFLSDLDHVAHEIGSVNVVKRENGQFKGYNTDCAGFKASFLPLLGDQKDMRALILGSGGSSKAVQYVLKSLKIPFLVVSRAPNTSQVPYSKIDQNLLKSHLFIINCSPLGMFPNIDECPPMPYEYLTTQHILFDLVYNPSQTLFLKKGETQGASTCNGQHMLEVQAEESWRVWNN